MATISDVENTIVSVIAPSKPNAYNVRYFPGTPFPQKLEDSLKANIYLVSVYPYLKGKRIPPKLNEEPQFAGVGANPETSVIVTELGRKSRIFQINVWTNSPDTRNTIGEALEEALNAINFLDFPDGTQGRILYFGEDEDDTGEKFNVYKRMYLYSVEYSTVKTETVPDACTLRILNIEAQVVDINNDNSVLVDEIL